MMIIVGNKIAYDFNPWGGITNNNDICIGTEELYKRLLYREHKKELETKDVKLARYTALLHEQGHIQAGHHLYKDRPIIKDGSSKHIRMEAEANSFVYRCIKKDKQHLVNKYYEMIMRNATIESFVPSLSN
jgi:HD superfamily phosphohydrolase